MATQPNPKNNPARPASFSHSRPSANSPACQACFHPHPPLCSASPTLRTARSPARALPLSPRYSPGPPVGPISSPRLPHARAMTGISGRNHRGLPSLLPRRDPRRPPLNHCKTPLTLIHHTAPRNPSRRLPIVPPAQKLCSTPATPHRRAPTPANHRSSSAARPGSSPGPSSPTSACAAPKLHQTSPP